MKKNLIHGTMALLFVLVVCISSAAAADTVTRDLPASADAGATITVSLTVDVETDATYYVIDEIVPSGWTISDASGGDTTEPGHIKWAVIMDAADITYSYTVDVPADATGACTFGGTYMFEGMADEATILGDTTVMVGDVDTVTRDLPASADAGATITVSLTVDVETDATYYVIDEIVPSGWTISDASGGDTTEPGHIKWAVIMDAADITYSYTVDVPADATGACTFGGTYMFEGMADEATILGDTTVTVGVSPPTLVTYTISNATITPPQTTSIDVRFSEQVSAIIKIEDASGNLVNELYTSASVTNPDPQIWDGTYTNGTTVPDAIYTVNVSGVSTTTGLSVVNTSETITVGVAVNQPPTAVIASPTATGTYHAGTEVSFLSTDSEDTDGDIVSYNWAFGDGDTSAVANPTHTYTTTGSMTVTLTVTDNGGANDTATVTIDVLEPEVTVSLYEGWNLIAVPVNDPTADTAAELASKITGCKEVVKWDASTQTYVPYTKIGDDWTGTDFVITGGMGLFVSVEGDTTVGFTGDAWS